MLAAPVVILSWTKINVKIGVKKLQRCNGTQRKPNKLAAKFIIGLSYTVAHVIFQHFNIH